MSEADLFLERDEDVATLVLNRPSKRNALTMEMWSSIPALLDGIVDDPSVKILVVRGADDTSFSAGADINEFQMLRANSQRARSYNMAAAHAEHALAEFPKPVIAMIQGPCIGGGCGIAVSCDLRFCDPTARFGITAANLGLVYSLPATKRLVDLVGLSSAKYILFSGEQLDVDHALRIGLVDRVVPPECLHESCMEFARAVASRAQYSVRTTKKFISLILHGQYEDDDATRRLRDLAFDSDDYKLGVRAFLEKRSPKFSYS